jgi:hypothetical protein
MLTLRKTWKHILEATRQTVTGISPDDWITYSWARKFDAYEDVPERYEPFFRPLRAEGLPLPYTLQTPSYQGFLHTTTEKILCVREHALYVLEQQADSYLETCFPVRDVYWMEFGSILLSSWFRIRGRSDRGQTAVSMMKFNSITDHLFAPVLSKIRTEGFRKVLALQEKNEEVPEALSRLTYKFGNYLKRSLLQGDRIHRAVFQPEIRPVRFTLLGRAFHRTLSGTHLCLLTERELIVIREEASRNDKSRYGGVWIYLPLERILDMQIQKNGNNLIVLTIVLPENMYWDLLFQPCVESELEEFSELLKKREPLPS